MPNAVDSLPPTPPITVLIVDDDVRYGDVAAAVVMASSGFRLLGVSGGPTEALVLLDELACAPDLVLMDVNLSGSSGIDAARMLLIRHPGAKVVLISTMSADELPVEATSCGAAGYLPKVRLGPGTLELVWSGAYDWTP